MTTQKLQEINSNNTHELHGSYNTNWDFFYKCWNCKKVWKNRPISKCKK